MNPLYFGSSQKALFGIYHQPQGPGRNRGVVLCNPLGEEAIRSHRAYRQLATMMARERFHVLRFDYYGTGDSAGDSGDGATGQWLEDIATATDELKDISGAAKVSWVGLRYGATLAIKAAQRRSDLDRLVLWDPVIDGKLYLRELRDMHVDFVRAGFAGRHRETNPGAFGHGEEVIGFPLTPALRGEIEMVDLTAIAKCRAKKVALILSQRTAAHQRFIEHMGTWSSEALVHDIAGGADWNSEEAFSDLAVSASLVPKELLQAIIDSLA